MYDQDIRNGRAPTGVEIVGKKALEGLKVIGTPQLGEGDHSEKPILVTGPDQRF